MRLEKKFKRKISSKRYFIAFDLPFDAKRNLHGVNKIFIKENRNFYFVPMEQLHLTIKFLGTDISANTLALIINAIENQLFNFNPFKLEVDSLRFGFPHQTIPKILFYNIFPTIELNALYKTISSTIAKLELEEIINKSFMKKEIYHLTVARLKHQPNRNYCRKIRDLIKNYKVEPILFEVGDFWLIESQLSSQNIPKYTYIHRFSLK